MIIPVGHRVLVKIDKAETVHKWVVNGKEVEFERVADKKLENAYVNTGELVAIGPQAWKAFGPKFSGEPWAKVGDKVHFSRYSGNFVDDSDTGITYKIMNDEDIVAIVRTENE